MESLERGLECGLLWQHWEEQRDYLRRFLIGLTRDIDLSDDLLQETYMKAQAGASSFRGGDIRAWLTAIAKNCFYGHVRKKAYHCEEPLLDECSPDDLSIGSSGHLDVIAVKRAVSELPSTLRIALLMKHYGGFTYKEISRHMSCPVGTAQQRVWSALNRLRRTLGITQEDVAAMSCEDLIGGRLLDYFYGTLPDSERAKVEKHLAECRSCRDELDALRKMASALDSVSDDFRVTRIIDLDAEGIPTEYSWWGWTNISNEPMTTFWWAVEKDIEIVCSVIDGNVVQPVVSPHSDKQMKHEVTLDSPIEPGKRSSLLLISRMVGERYRSKRQDDGTWRYELNATPNSEMEWIQVAAIRLPAGSELVSADPEPTEVRRNCGTTLVWKSMLPKISEEEFARGIAQFSAVVEYRL